MFWLLFVSVESQTLLSHLVATHLNSYWSKMYSKHSLKSNVVYVLSLRSSIFLVIQKRHKSNQNDDIDILIGKCYKSIKFKV